MSALVTSNASGAAEGGIEKLNRRICSNPRFRNLLAARITELETTWKHHP
jgi:hypothetical protein